MGEVRFMISEAAKQVNVESHVLRYWEEELDLTIGRTEMGHRYYTKDDIQLFCCIKKLKNEGMLLKDLKPLIPELKEKKSKLKTPEKEKTQLQTVTSETGDILLPLNTIDQMRALVGDVFREALNENNSILKNDISSTITSFMKWILYLRQKNAVRKNISANWTCSSADSRPREKNPLNQARS